jgi:hypothetical protein
MNELPAGVRWGLVLMGALLLSQSVGVHRTDQAPIAGIQAASPMTPTATDAVTEAEPARTTPSCGSIAPGAAPRSWDSLRLEEGLEVAADHDSGPTSTRRLTPAPRRSC